MKLGIMQGRFTNKDGFLPQLFPWDNWECEFEIAEFEQIDRIEWMLNYDSFQKNPLLCGDERKSISTCINSSGVSIDSVCINYYMKESIIYDSGLELFEQICSSMEDIGASLAVIPLFEDNMPDSRDKEEKLLSSLKNAENVASEHGIRIAIESDWEAVKIVEILKSFSNVGCCYDVGNAAGLGRDIVNEIHILGDRLINLHIKDKPVGGSSVMLGQGDADLRGAFSALNDIGYQGNLILESYFGENVVEDTRNNINYLRGLIS